MVFPKARLVVSGCLFLAWLGFLAYLVVRTRDLVVVSRPQILVSNVCVLAEVHDDSGRPSRTVQVGKVLWSADAADAALAGKTLTLDELPDIAAAQGYDGPGEYLVPLLKVDERGEPAFHVTPLPPVPGFDPRQLLELISMGDEPERVLPLVAELTRQTPAEAKAWVQALPRVLARNLAWEDADAWRSRFTQAGATVRLAEGEVRIYRATVDALAQFRELKPAP